MAVIPPGWAGPIGTLASLLWDNGGRLVLAFEDVGAAPGRLLALAAEELSTEFADLATELIVLGVESLDPPYSLRVHPLAVSGLLAQLQILAPQVIDLVAQLDHLSPRLSHQVGEIDQLRAGEYIDKRSVHDKDACTPE